MADERIVELARKAANGESEALEQLLETKYRCILAQAFYMLGDDQAAQDVTQEVCMNINRNIASLRQPQAIEGWIYCIVQNACKAYWKRTARITQKEALGFETEWSEISDQAQSLSDNQLKETDPEQALIGQELRERILVGIRRLPQKRKMFVLLYYYHGFTYDEIAAATQTPIRTVSSNITRARKGLAKMFDEKEIMEMGFYGKQQELQTSMASMASMALLPEGLLTAALRGPGFGMLDKKALGMFGKTAISKSAVSIGSGFAAAAIAVIALSFQPAAAPPVQAQTEPVAIDAYIPDPQYIREDGQIVFSGGLVYDSALNPRSAVIADLDMEVASASWSIAGAGALDTGDGLDPSEAISRLQTGSYTLTFTLIDQDGNVVMKSRDFEIA